MNYYKHWKPSEDDIKNFREEWLLVFASDEISLEQAHEAATLCIGEFDYVPGANKFKDKIKEIKVRDSHKIEAPKKVIEKPFETRKEVATKHLTGIKQFLKDKGLWHPKPAQEIQS